MHNHVVRFVAPLLLVATAAALPACQSTGKPAEENVRAVSSLQTTQQEVAALDAAVEQTVSTMQALRSRADLSAAHQAFAKSVAQLGSQFDRTVAVWRDMRDRGEAYVQRWQEEVAQFESASLKEAAERRRAKVQARYDEITADARKAEATYQTFSRQVTEIDKALSLDPTPAAVTAIGDAIDESLETGGTLHEQIADVERQLAAISEGMAAESPGTTKQ